MENVLLDIKEYAEEYAEYRYHKTVGTTTFADIYGKPGNRREQTHGISPPPSFTASLFSCCSREWGPRHEPNQTYFSFIGPKEPQNAVIESNIWSSKYAY